MGDAEGGKLFGEIRRVCIEDGDAGIVPEIVPEVVRQLGVQLEEEQAGARMHAPGNLAGMTALAGAELRDDAGNREVELAGHPIDEDFGTGDNGSDLHGALKESLEE
jgi:hypothetical protein